MTSQQHADAALAQWQSLRALPPDDRIAAIMADFFAPPTVSEAEYDITLRDVAAEMEMADA